VLKLILVPLLLTSILQARENPFFPADTAQDMPYTSNQKFNYPPFKQASVVLPSSARVIKKVTIEYETLDASTEIKTIEINNEIDWHLPIFISQSYSPIKHENQKLENILREDFYRDNTKKEQKVIPKKAKKNKLKKKSKAKTKSKAKFKKIASFHKNTFMSNGKTIKIITKNKIIRNFSLVKPHRIVVDLKADLKMKSYKKSLKNSIFKTIRIGNHTGYYRIVIELDGMYKYNTKQLKDGYSITLK